MEHQPYHILWVSSTQFIPTAVQQMSSRQNMPAIQFSQAAPYYPAIQSVEYASPDAIFVMDDFDSLAILEFIHHARLLNSQVPIIILCREYDAALDYKSHRLGATDCVPVYAVDAQFVHDLMQKWQPPIDRSDRQTMARKSVLQFPVLFK